MRKLALLGVLGFLLLGGYAVAVPDPKATICHKEPQKQDITISISQSAVEAHVKNHGDTVGACKEGDIPVDVPDETITTPTSPTNPTPTVETTPTDTPQGQGK